MDFIDTWPDELAKMSAGNAGENLILFMVYKV